MPECRTANRPRSIRASGAATEVRVYTAARLGWGPPLELQRGIERDSRKGREATSSGPAGSVPGVAIRTTVHPESGWQPAPARGGRAGGQDRPEGDGRRVER